ncbi:MAG: hypothetical protein HYT15_03760 [Candidatus Magasanikbacteria bacterium]|nr:hypothetical protein [Candidatus Magasanikbacteria bacterium]
MDISKYKNLKEFDSHALVVELDEPSVGLKGFIAIDRKAENFPALGATRLWKYPLEEDALNDALRLAKLMGKKSAMAGLPYTGAKAVLMLPEEGIKNREEYFKVYAQKVNELSGQFITGTDVGLTDNDLEIMSKNSKFVIGMNVPAAYYTAVGVFNVIRESLEYKFGSENISSRTFAIQGLGKTGYELLKLLYAEGAKIFVSEINIDILEQVCRDFPLVKKVLPADIHKQEVDVFCPCAMSHSINSRTVSELKCVIVAGSANNQLEDEEAGEKLHKMGIVYAPDYLSNSGGLISVVDQFENKKHDNKRILLKLSKIPAVLRAIFLRSEKERRSISSVADDMVQESLVKEVSVGVRSY